MCFKRRFLPLKTPLSSVHILTPGRGRTLGQAFFTSAGVWGVGPTCTASAGRSRVGGVVCIHAPWHKNAPQGEPALPRPPRTASKHKKYSVSIYRVAQIVSAEVREHKQTAECAEQQVQSKTPLPELRKVLGRNQESLFQLHNVVESLIRGRRNLPPWIQIGNKLILIQRRRSVSRTGFVVPAVIQRVTPWPGPGGSIAYPPQNKRAGLWI